MMCVDPALGPIDIQIDRRPPCTTVMAGLVPAMTVAEEKRGH